MIGGEIMASGVLWTDEQEIERLGILYEEIMKDNKKIVYAYKKIATAEQWDKLKKKLNNDHEEE